MSHLHLCFPIDPTRETATTLKQRVRTELQTLGIPDQSTSLCLRINALFFLNHASMLLTTTPSTATTNNPSSSSLLNMTFQKEDLSESDLMIQEQIQQQWYGRLFGTEMHLRQQIQQFMLTNAERQKILCIDHADQLSESMQSELREYTGRSVDSVRLVLLTYPHSWKVFEKHEDETHLHRDIPLLFMESLQSRLCPKVVLPSYPRTEPTSSSKSLNPDLVRLLEMEQRVTAKKKISSEQKKQTS